ncbi:MAG: photosystem II reaction center protein PsbN [Oscillatoriales cyanobacterium SM2_2_1]|nr:photosystem II reaction center protein PsbN [Oscillatoriales cyanobacterium SM2_2_1]
MDNATSIGLTFAAVIICLTAFSIYTSFGPPSRELGDPFEDHDD